MILYILALFVLALLFIFLVLLIKGSAKKLQSEEIKSVIQELTEEQKNSKMLDFEKALVEKLNISSEKIRWFLLAERLLIISCGILLYVIFGVMGIVFMAAIAIAIVMNGKVKNAINRSGITHISDTVAFMDYFVPQIAAGASAEDAFSKFIENLEVDSPTRPSLIEYYTAKKAEDLSYETPKDIRDITSVFENAEYNERLGSDNYLYIIEQAKTDLFQKAIYYQDYQTKVGEVIRPMKLAYYGIIPLIFLMLWGSVGDFWFTPVGWITGLIILVIFFFFNFLCNKLTIKTLTTIVG